MFTLPIFPTCYNPIFSLHTTPLHIIRFAFPQYKKQSDLYVLAVLHSEVDPSATLDWDPDELMGAQWMRLEAIERIAAPSNEQSLSGRVSANNWNMIRNALHGGRLHATDVSLTAIHVFFFRSPHLSHSILPPICHTPFYPPCVTRQSWAVFLL